MRKLTTAAVSGMAMAACMSGAAFAQTRAVPPVAPVGQGETMAQTVARYNANTGGEPDVFLDIPNLEVESIDIEVDNLEVHLALDARLGSLLKLTAGADASIDKVKINIKGVKAQAQLKVRLDNVAAIIDRTLTTVDRNPEIIERALGSVDNAVNTVGGVANTAVQPGGVLSQTINSLGQTVTRTVDAAGNIVERVTDKNGALVSSRIVTPAGSR